jgi:hypothetical protein
VTLVTEELLTIAKFVVKRKEINLFSLYEIIIIIIIIITRSVKKNLEAVTGKHSIDSQQKTAILGTSRIILKILQCEA